MLRFLLCIVLFVTNLKYCNTGSHSVENYYSLWPFIANWKHLFSVFISVLSVYAFSAINNVNMQYLWNWTQHNLTIQSGRLFFRMNPKLCMSEIHKMVEKTAITVKQEEGDFHNNGQRASCEYITGRHNQRQHMHSKIQGLFLVREHEEWNGVHRS